MKERNHDRPYTRLVNADKGHYILDRMYYPSSNRIEICPLPVLAWEIRYTPGEPTKIIPTSYSAISDMWRGEILEPGHRVRYRDGTLEDYEVWKRKATLVDKGEACNKTQTDIDNRQAEIEDEKYGR